jgi:hypothetical protein
MFPVETTEASLDQQMETMKPGRHLTREPKKARRTAEPKIHPPQLRHRPPQLLHLFLLHILPPVDAQLPQASASQPAQSVQRHARQPRRLCQINAFQPYATVLCPGIEHTREELVVEVWDVGEVKMGEERAVFG